MPTQLLKKCWMKGIQLSVVDNNLNFKAAEGAMSDLILAEIKQKKQSLIELLQHNSNYYDARPLSANEKSLWFLYRLMPESIAYNMAYAIQLKSHYCIDQIEQAFGQLCDAYPIITQRYGERDGEPLQWLLKAKPPQVHFDQKQQLSKAELDHWIVKQADHPLLPDQGKTCHIALLHHENDHKQVDCYLSITIHHISADFISFEILRRDFMRLLNGQKINKRQYPEHNYQIWSQRQVNQPQLDAENYWQQSLKDLPQLNLPTDYHYRDNLTAMGEEIQQTISGDLAVNIRQYCQQHNITHYVWWLGAFQWFMARLSGQSQFIIGTPSAGRLTPEDIELVGYLVNPIALYCEVDASLSFNHWLTAVKNQSQQMLRHQAYPFAQLMDKLPLDRNSNRSPVFQHMFTLNKASTDVFASSTVAKELLAEQRGAAHELNLVVVDEGKNFHCKWRYNNSLYKQKTVKNIQEMFMHWVSQLITDDSKTLDHLQTAPSHLLAKLVGEQCKPINDSAWQAFVEQVKKTPNNIAISDKDISYTYQQFKEKVEQAALTLSILGFAQGDRLGILLPRSIEQVIAMFASWHLAGSFLVLDTEWPQQRIDFICDNAKLKLMLCEQKSLDKYHKIEQNTLTQWLITKELLTTTLNETSDRLKQIKLVQSTHQTTEKEAYLIYTSGSTGQPKAVMVSQNNLIQYVTGIERAINLTANAKMSSLSKHSADLGYTSLFGALLTGREFVVLDESLTLNSQALLTQLTKTPVDYLKIVPSYLNGLLLAEADNAFLPKQALIFGGEKLTPEVIKHVRQFKPSLNLYNHYGPTETTIGALVHPIPLMKHYQQQDEIPLGLPLANIEIKVVDTSNNIQAHNLPGELHIAGPSVTQGYLHEPSTTKEKFYKIDAKTWYRTGDKVRFDEDKLYYLGRNDDQIKIRGHRVELGEVETWIKQHIDQVAVTHQQTSKGHSQLLAHVVTSKEKIETVKALCLNALPDYMQPSNWLLLNTLPRLANGKIDKKSLVLNAIDKTSKSSPLFDNNNDLNEAEESLLIIWKSLLNQPELTVNDNFFNVGGDSILGLQVIAKARSQKINIKPQELFQHKTIRTLVLALGLANTAKVKNDKPSEKEQILLQIIRDLLNNKDIAKQDNFFTVGGDSILSLQLVAKARQKGIQLLPKDIFEHKTVEKLAVALKLTEPNIEKNKLLINELRAQKNKLPTQSFSLTPIQAWFFEQNLATPDYWNQSLVLNSKKAIDIAAFTLAAEQLLKTHASLRLAFREKNGVWQQYYQPYQDNLLLQVVQVSDEIPDEKVIANYQTQFSLAKAPLLRLVYFTKSKILLCTAHHLIVDAVSWQIIVTDLIKFYHAQCQQSAILQKSTPQESIPIFGPPVEFYQWQEYLQKIIDQNVIEQQKEYWLMQLIPISQQPASAVSFNNSYEDSVHQVSILDHITTDSLLKQANQAYNTMPQELLLTALAMTLTAHWQLTELTIELEGHGREADLIKGQNSLDLSSTVGWFTSRFPQKFKALDNDIEKSIITYKEHLRKIPNNGIGFGLLRYLHPTFKQITDLGTSELVSFNYLGNRTSKIDDVFNLAEGLVANTRAANNQRAHLLDINIMVSNEQLHIDWCYAKSHPLFSQITQLIERFSLTLNTLISHCLIPEQGRATAADFPLAKMTDDNFILLLNELVNEHVVNSIATCP